MSNIQDQILALQRKQAKIDEYKAILTDLDKRADNNQHKDLKTEIFSQLSNFISEKISELETGIEVKAKLPTSNPGVLSQAEIDLFRSIVQRTAEREAGGSQSSPLGPPIPPKPKPVPLDPNDPLRFLLANKHLERKRVKFDTENGVVVGVVVGLIAPNVIVKTDTGFEIPVEPSRLQAVVGGK